MALPFQQPQQGAQQPQQSPPMPQQSAAPEQPPMPMQGQPQPGMEGQGAEFDPSVINGEELQMLLFTRLQELSPEEARAFADLITPETVIPLFKLLPELGILFDEILSQRAQGMGQDGAGMPQPQEQPMDESENPLVNDNISRGLMG